MERREGVSDGSRRRECRQEVRQRGGVAHGVLRWRCVSRASSAFCASLAGGQARGWVRHPSRSAASLAAGRRMDGGDEYAQVEGTINQEDCWEVRGRSSIVVRAVT